MSDEPDKLDVEEEVEDLDVQEGAEAVVGGLNPQPLPPEPPREGKHF